MEKKSKKLSRHRPFVRPFRGIWTRIEGGEQGFYRPRASNLWNRFPAWRSRASVTPFLCDKRLYAKKVVVPGYIFLATVAFFGKARKFRFSWEFKPGMKILERREKQYTIHWNNYASLPSTSERVTEAYQKLFYENIANVLSNSRVIPTILYNLTNKVSK